MTAFNWCPVGNFWRPSAAQKGLLPDFHAKRMTKLHFFPFFVSASQLRLSVV
jgi:hypothetical protein